MQEDPKQEAEAHGFWITKPSSGSSWRDPLTGFLRSKGEQVVHRKLPNHLVQLCKTVRIESVPTKSIQCRVAQSSEIDDRREYDGNAHAQTLVPGFPAGCGCDGLYQNRLEA